MQSGVWRLHMSSFKMFTFSQRLYVLAGALVIAALVAFGVYLFSSRERDIWRAVIVALPEKITTKEISSTSYYVLKQTHEPVFRKDDGYNYTSKILRKWFRSVDYREYALCPDTTLSFDGRHRFSLEFFKNHLIKVTSKFDKNAVVFLENSCVNVKFTKPSRRYLDYLSAYANSPSIEVSSAVEAGLGAFLVSSIAKEEIILKRRQPVRLGFNKMFIYDYKGPEDIRLKKNFISDYNFVSTRKGLDLPASKYVSFETMAPKSMVLLINLPDQEQRRALYNCIDIDGLRRAFSAEARTFYNVQTILPVGVPGGRPGKPEQSCVIRKADGEKFKPVLFANWRSDNIGQLKRFFEEFSYKTGIKVKVENYPAAQLAARMRNKPKPYNLVVIMTGADSDDNFRLLASYFGKNSLLDFKIPEIEGLYGDLIKEADPEKQKNIAGMIADKIAQGYSLLPLYQSVTSVYYPKAIKNIVVGREFLEYPEVADFRW